MRLSGVRAAGAETPDNGHDPIQTVTAGRGEIAKVRVQWGVHVREQSQPGRDHVAIEILHLVEDDQPGEVHVRERLNRVTSQLSR